jgi:hypothetical protein
MNLRSWSLRSWSLRSRIERLPPYPSLLLLVVPTLIVECTKLAAVVVAGMGHWLEGAFVLAGAYGASAFATERLFAIVRPKLLKLPWFARLWSKVSPLRAKMREWLGQRNPGRAGSTEQDR